MSEYNRSEAYAFPPPNIPAFKSSAAPAPDLPDGRPRTNPESGFEATRALRKKSVNSALFAVKLFTVSAILLALLGAILCSNVSLIRLERESEAVKARISAARSENTRLIMRLNSEASVDKVDAYAVSALGMHKLESYQIYYLENLDGDKVVVADGKKVKDEIKAAE